MANKKKFFLWVFTWVFLLFMGFHLGLVMLDIVDKLQRRHTS